MFGIGIIGCGKIAQVRHIPEYNDNPDAKLVAFYDLNTARAKALAEQYGGRAYESVEALLADLNVDAVSVCSVNASHAEITVAALEAHGLALSDLTVTAPKGFRAKVAADAAGNVVATLELDEDVLRPLAADGVSSPLTILSNGDGTLTVKADVANGVRGFWYTLYAADELGGAWSPVAAGAGIAGEPSLQAKVDDAPASPSITLSPTDAKKFYKLVVTDVKP